MPSRGIMRAKQKRAAALGNSARFYLLNTGTASYHVPGGQGFGQHNANIGSMLSLGIAKQTRKAGGNNVCVIKDKFGRVQLNSGCGCQGPKAYCPNCWNRTTRGTMSTK